MKAGPPSTRGPRFFRLIKNLHFTERTFYRVLTIDRTYRFSRHEDRATPAVVNYLPRPVKTTCRRLGHKIRTITNRPLTAAEPLSQSCRYDSINERRVARNDAFQWRIAGRFRRIAWKLPVSPLQSVANGAEYRQLVEIARRPVPYGQSASGIYLYYDRHREPVHAGVRILHDRCKKPLFARYSRSDWL